MPDPMVCCVLLTRDRPQMAARAVASFRAQSYERKQLVIWDTGNDRRPDKLSYELPDGEWCVEDVPDFTIGKLRNRANDWACNHRSINADIIAHWDSDDVSHPSRLAEQVALLQSSGTDAVGYSDLLFWDTRQVNKATGQEIPGPLGSHPVYQFQSKNEAWIYTRGSRFNVPGTSLMYWRKTWERMPFPDLPIPGEPNSTGEDTTWQNAFWGKGMKIAAVSSVPHQLHPPTAVPGAAEPRMIASLHGSNTQSYLGFGQGEQWRRVPEFDSYCAERMRL